MFGMFREDTKNRASILQDTENRASMFGVFGLTVAGKNKLLLLLLH